ncbi:phosphotransferase enzyme family protein [Apiospora arundinis]
MDTNAIVDLVCKVQDQVWLDKIKEAYASGALCHWVSSFHPNKLPCTAEGTFYNGSFNAGLKMVFSEGTAWMLRFPRGGIIHTSYVDEKVAMEVEALTMIREKTTIPVPIIQAWGLAADNPLGLGPFIIMEFLNGVSLSDVLEDPTAETPTRLIREDIDDKDIEVIYRQFVNILLQLFKLDFDQIGSLATPADRDIAPAPRHPLTFKAQNILHGGGVYTLGDRCQGFTTTTEYLNYLLGQDWEQLNHQPNSIAGRYDAEKKYRTLKILQSLIPNLVHPDYDRGKFKLICDDLGLANLIVRSKTDLTVVGVIDLEWSYAGPAQLSASAPWWLLQDRPVNSAWDYGEAPPKVAERYFNYQDIFMRVLEEEEAKSPEYREKEFSKLVRWSQTSGAMWLHMLLAPGFIDHHSFPSAQLQAHFGGEWSMLMEKLQIVDSELESFTARKVRELAIYYEELESIENDEALINSGEMSKEEFLDRWSNRLPLSM